MSRRPVPQPVQELKPARGLCIHWYSHQQGLVALIHAAPIGNRRLHGIDLSHSLEVSRLPSIRIKLIRLASVVLLGAKNDGNRSRGFLSCKWRL